ncbi:response regulator transcription factor [Streptomyces sp. NPDC013953]|uniref:helix-turn-helix transcriptional regulator n=1 Tax=Streptomyces sp. NPDC013953 TaxID=3364868 RepID=UPI0036F4E49D
MDHGGETVPYLATSAYKRMLDLAVGVLEAGRPDDVWPLISSELLQSLDGTLLLRKDVEWTPAGGAVTAWRRGSPEPDVLGAEAARHIRAGFPFAGHYGTTPDRTPRTAAEIAGERTWRRSGTAVALREELGTDQMLGIPLPASGSTVHGFIIHRAGADFRPQERLYAAQVQPLLSGAAAQARLLSHCRRTERTDPARYGLTPRETAVLGALASGLPATGIARRLRISERTVHKHLQNLYRKLDTVDRLSTVLRAQELGLLTAPAPARSGERSRRTAGPGD